MALASPTNDGIYVRGCGVASRKESDGVGRDGRWYEAAPSCGGGILQSCLMTRLWYAIFCSLTAVMRGHVTASPMRVCREKMERGRKE